MQAVDFARSFVTFVTPGRANNARIQVEARVEWMDLAHGTTQELFLVASCKSERTYAESDLFQSPNYDFCGVFNETEFAILRRHAAAGDARPDVGPVAGRFERVNVNIVRVEATPLETRQAAVRATLAGKVLVAATEISGADGDLRCRLEYPVKTMNANDIDWIYQVDTGPIPFPNWEADCGQIAGRFDLAYVAWNATDFADFVIQRPTELVPGAVTWHYSEVLASVPAHNWLLALDD